jgi:hypothetical protein
LSKKAQWHTEEGLTAYSCGRSFGFGLLSTKANRTEFPLLINMTNVPNTGTANQPALVVKARGLWALGHDPLPGFGCVTRIPLRSRLSHRQRRIPP